MIRTTKRQFTKIPGNYLYHLSAGEELRMETDDGKTLSLSGELVSSMELGPDTCGRVCSREAFLADGKGYLKALEQGTTCGVLLDNNDGLLVRPAVVELGNDSNYIVSFDKGRSFALSPGEMAEALDMIGIAKEGHPELGEVEEKITDQLEEGRRVDLSLSDGEALKPAWTEQMEADLLLGQHGKSKVPMEFLDYDGSSRQMFTDIMEQMKLTREDLAFAEESGPELGR